MDSSALPKSSWRFKMEHGEKVDAGITFQGGQGYGGVNDAFAYKRTQTTGGNKLTRVKQRSLIGSSNIGALTNLRAGGNLYE